MDLFKSKIHKEIIDLYLADNYPWIVGYSGGKDSTLTLQLVWEALSKIPKKKLHKEVYVLSSDTLVEIPKVVNYVDKSLERINESAKKQRLPIKAIKLHPDIKDTFWVNLIGRGYPAPTTKFRWCTDRLKIDPANKFIKEKVNEYGEVVVVLGVRKSESVNREKTINEHKIEGSRLSRHSTLPNAYVYTPIEDWTVDEVWDYLLKNPSPFGIDNRELFNMYKQANAGECPVIVELKDGSESQSCGNSRFGCWTCTVVTNEKSLSSLIDNGERWLLPLKEYRELLVESVNPENSTKYRDYRRRNGQIYYVEKDGAITLGRGSYTFAFRKFLLEKLLETELKVNELGGYGLTLITREELLEIQNIWKIEEGDWENSVFRIYKKVYNVDLSSEHIQDTTFSSTEKEIVERLCSENNIDPKLVLKLINTVYYNSSFSSSQVLKNIEKILNQEWRSEEEILRELENQGGEKV